MLNTKNWIFDIDLALDKYISKINYDQIIYYDNSEESGLSYYSFTIDKNNIKVYEKQYINTECYWLKFNDITIDDISSKIAHRLYNRITDKIKCKEKSLEIKIMVDKFYTILKSL